MGGLAVAWQVNVTRSPSRTDRGSIDRMTVGGSGEREWEIIRVLSVDIHYASTAI